jgi:ferrochelatase
MESLAIDIPHSFPGRAGSTGGFDAILIVGFGGPERREDVMPFLENVTRGRGVPRERLLAVAEHYYHFGGASPINSQVRELIGALEPELTRQRINLPTYWGNRNWHPMLADVLARMTADGVKRALAIVLAAYSSYSSCRQYLEDIGRAQASVGPGAPRVDKIRVFFNHPDFIAANSERVASAVASFAPDQACRLHVAFTSHSIPLSMAQTCDYERQIRETCRLVAESAGIEPERWSAVYQSRSGRPEDPWLGPDILDHLKDLKHRGVESVVVHPIGFLSDHLEVLYDLDVEARDLCGMLGLQMVRSPAVGTHPRFVSMLCSLVAERLGPDLIRPAVGRDGPHHDLCPETCCPAPARPAVRATRGPGDA